MQQIKMPMWQQLLTDESGYISSKRTVGCLMAVALVFALVFDVMTDKVTIDPNIISAVVAVCLGCFGFSTADKFSPASKVMAEADAMATTTDEVIK